MKKLLFLPRKAGALLIRLYQATLSPDHGPAKGMFPHGYCPFYPTCSEYGRKAVLKYGLLRGSAKTLWRIFRCNPWTKGGEDLP